MMRIDTHCHLDFYPHPEQVAKEAEQGNTFTIAVTSLPSHFAMGFPQVQKFKRVRLALGLHPLLAEEHTKNELDAFQRLLTKTSYIGEIGLDFSKEGISTQKRQIESLCFVLNLIGDRPRFISLHSRGAENEVLEHLEKFKITNAVFHWYTGNESTLDKIIQAGHFLSINPAMINSKKGQKIIQRLPIDRILTETDGPYVQIKSRPAIPNDVKKVLVFLAKSRNISEEVIEQQVYSNFEQIINRFRKAP